MHGVNRAVAGWHSPAGTCRPVDNAVHEYAGGGRQGVEGKLASLIISHDMLREGGSAQDGC